MIEISSKLTLGETYRHKHHDIGGRLTAYIAYETGCNQVGLTRLLKGKLETDWYDETSIEESRVTVEQELPAPRAGRRSRNLGSRSTAQAPGGPQPYLSAGGGSTAK